MQKKGIHQTASVAILFNSCHLATISRFAESMEHSCIFCGELACAVRTITSSYIEVKPPVKELKVINMFSGTLDLQRIFEPPVELQFHNIRTMLVYEKDEEFSSVMSFMQGDEFKREESWVLTDSYGLAVVKYAKHVPGSTLLSRNTRNGEETQIWTCLRCMQKKDINDEMLAHAIQASMQTKIPESDDYLALEEARDIELATELSLIDSHVIYL